MDRWQFTTCEVYMYNVPLVFYVIVEDVNAELYIFYGCRYPNTENDEQHLCPYGLPLIPTDFRPSQQLPLANA